MKRFILFTALNLVVVVFSYSQWIFDELSEPKGRMGATTLGEKAYFAAGDNDTHSFSAVEIYDALTGEWDSVINLSVSRSIPACVSSGTKIFVAGGVDIFTGAVFAEVDIWDTEFGYWETEYLSVPRFFVSAVAARNEVLFAGGMNPNIPTAYNVVDIYNIETATWTIDYLSEPRAGMASAVAGDLAFFAGGFDLVTSEVSNVVDVYRFSTKTWTTKTLSQARAFAAAATAGSKVLIAGGTYDVNTQSDVVDIYDTLTGEWTTATLSFPRSFYQWEAATVCNKAFFVGGGTINISTGTWTTLSDIIDIYNIELDEWNVDQLPKPLIAHAAAGIRNNLIVAGGLSGPPYEMQSSVEILVDPDCFGIGINKSKEKKSLLSIYPNPSDGYFYFNMPDQRGDRQAEIAIYNLQGQMVQHQILPAGDHSVLVQLPDGVYVMQIRIGDKVQKELITVIK